MPFRSKRQQRFMFATMPSTAKGWAGETDFSKLPEKARKKRKQKKDTANLDDMKMSIDDLAALVDKFAKEVQRRNG